VQFAFVGRDSLHLLVDLYHTTGAASWPPWKDLGLEWSGMRYKYHQISKHISNIFQTYSKHIQKTCANRLKSPTSWEQSKASSLCPSLCCETALPKVETRCFGKAHIGVEVQHQSPSNIRIVRKPCAVWLRLEKQNPAPRYRGGSKRKWTGFVLECKKRTQQRFCEYVHYQHATNHSKHATALQNRILDGIPKNDSTMNISSIQQLHRLWHFNWMLIHSCYWVVIYMYTYIHTYIIYYTYLYITSIYNIHCHTAVWTKAQWASAAPWCRSQE